MKSISNQEKAIQIYESAPANGSYFITSHGLYMQAMQDALVSDFFGETVFGMACPSEWKDIAFGGLHTADGRIWRGTCERGQWHIEEDL